MEEQKKKQDKRIHVSTLRLTVAAVLVGVVALTFSYTHAWGQRMKSIETTASTNVFADFETQTITGEAFTDGDAGSAKVIAYNVWETT